MKTETNSNLVKGIFNGTYESIWEVTEYNEEGTEEVEVEYEFKDYMKSIIEAYKTCQKEINDWLNERLPFKVKLNFTGDSHSPSYYNFSTDTIDFNLTFKKDEFLRELEPLKDDKSFIEFLHDNYTSRDGFISFTPNNYKDLLNNILNEKSEYDQSIGAVINYFTGNWDGRDFYDTPEGIAYDYWQGQGYCGLDYKIVKEG